MKAFSFTLLVVKTALHSHEKQPRSVDPPSVCMYSHLNSSFINYSFCTVTCNAPLFYPCIKYQSGLGKYLNDKQQHAMMLKYIIKDICVEVSAKSSNLEAV